MGDAVRHLGVQKAVGAVSLECGDFLALAVLAVGAHGDEHIAELACSGLRAQNHTAGVRGGGHLLTDETEDARPACTQRTGQRIRLVAELVAMARTLSAILDFTRPSSRPLSTSDTVETETPALFAISFIVTMRQTIHPN